jgi:putative ABC transport system permease protein
MSFFKQLSSGLRNLLFRRSAAKDVEDELSGYFEDLVESGVRSGLSRDEAIRSARLQMGSRDSTKERIGAIGWEHFIESIIIDIAYAWRMMCKTPLTTGVIVLTLAIGIGANSAMFGIVFGLLLKPLPFPAEERIAIVHMHFAPQNNPRGNMSLADFADWRANNRSFESVAAYSSSRMILAGGEYPAEEVVGAKVTADYFNVLRVPALRGHTFVNGDDSPSAAPQVIISDALWQRRFQRSPDVIGRVLKVNGAPATVIGVVEGSQGFPRPGVDVWQNQTVRVTRRGPFFFHGIGRLKEGVELAQAQAELNTIAKGIEASSQHTYSHLSMPVEPLHEYLVVRTRPALLMIFGAVAVVLLIALVNVANLLLARASVRQRELATRLSLGATRGRLLQQLLTESVLLSTVGGASGLLLAFEILRVFRNLNPANSPIAYQAQMNWPVFAFAATTSLFAGILFGIAPALHSSRTAMHAGMREGGRTQTSSIAHNRTRSALVIAEVALSFVLILAAGLLLRSFTELQRANIGVSAEPEDVLSLAVTPTAANIEGDQNAKAVAVSQFYERVIADLQSLPGVQKVAVADSLPPNFAADDDTFRIAGRTWSEEAFPSTSLPSVSPDYFGALGVPLVRGRFFAPSDAAKSEPVTIISQQLAQKYFGGVDPLGQKIGPSGPGNDVPFMTIVGVVGDVKYWGVESTFKPAYYVPFAQNASGSSFVIVRAPNAAELGPSIQQRLRALDKDVVVRRMLTLQDVLDEAVSQPRLRTTLVAVFGAMALLLASVGMYGVIAYSVAQRTPEIGIRMALGARPVDVLKMVMWNGVVRSFSGVAIGLLVGVLATRVIAPFLFETHASDPLTLALSCILLMGFSLVATFIPALRATKIEPLIALRHE